MFQNIGEMLLLLWRTLQALPATWRQRRKVLSSFSRLATPVS